MNPVFNNGFANNPITDFIQRFNQFRQTCQSNPQQYIQNMLNSGQITQQDYNNAVNTANQLFRMMNGPGF